MFLLKAGSICLTFNVGILEHLLGAAFHDIPLEISLALHSLSKSYPLTTTKHEGVVIIAVHNIMCPECEFQLASLLKFYTEVPEGLYKSLRGYEDHY